MFGGEGNLGGCGLSLVVRGSAMAANLVASELSGHEIACRGFHMALTDRFKLRILLDAKPSDRPFESMNLLNYSQNTQQRLRNHCNRSCNLSQKRKIG